MREDQEEIDQARSSTSDQWILNMQLILGLSGGHL